MRGDVLALHTGGADLQVGRSRPGSGLTLTIYGPSPALKLRTDRRGRLVAIAKINNLWVEPTDYWLQRREGLEVIPLPGCTIEIPPGLQLQLGHTGFIHYFRGDPEELHAQVTWPGKWRRLGSRFVTLPRIKCDLQPATH